MATTVAHAVSASWIAVMAINIQPDETPYILTAVLAAAVLDLDHLVFIIRDRAFYQGKGYAGNLHHARSPLHELFGLLLMGGVAGFFTFIDKKAACLVFLAFTVHLLQDWFMGISFPLSPIDNTPVQFFTLSFAQKVIIDAMLLVVFGGLWMLFLTGAR